MSGTGCMVAQSFAVGGNNLYPEFWAKTGAPWYPRYKTPTVAPEPSIEWVAGANCLTGGRIGTHMVL
jgi:hypothetical protein